MAKQGEPSYIGRLKGKIKKNERRINELEEKLKDHDENCQPIINELQEEIRRLKEENDTLREVIKNLQENVRKNEEKIGELETGHEFLVEENESIKQTNGELKKEFKLSKKHFKEQLEKHDEEIKKFKLSEDELIIRQLCSKVQQNILRIVLQENFDEIENKSVKDIKSYINQIEDENEKEAANARWEKLKKNIKWNDYLIRQLKPVTKRGNEMAHPPLTEEKIDDAKMNLEEREELGKRMVKAVEQLKDIWKQTNYELRTSSVEGQDQGDPGNLPAMPATGQDQDTVTYGSITSKKAGGHCIHKMASYLY